MQLAKCSQDKLAPGNHSGGFQRSMLMHSSFLSSLLPCQSLKATRMGADEHPEQLSTQPGLGVQPAPSPPQGNLQQHHPLEGPTTENKENSFWPQKANFLSSLRNQPPGTFSKSEKSALAPRTETWDCAMILCRCWIPPREHITNWRTDSFTFPHHWEPQTTPRGANPLVLPPLATSLLLAMTQQ